MPASRSSHLETLGGKSVSKHIFVVDRIQFLMGTELRSLFPCWLLARGHALLLEAFCIPFHVPHSLSSCQQWQIESVSCFESLWLLFLPPVIENSLLQRAQVMGSGPPRLSYFKVNYDVTPRWCSGKESACQCRRCKRHRFNPWVEKIPWRRKQQPTLVFLPGKFYGHKSLEGYTVHGSHRESDITEHPRMRCDIT